jgi:hypothetical protein
MEKSLDHRAAYRELVRAWLLLADIAEELAKLRHSSASIRARHSRM